jgi:glycerol-3-phosphate dehydrogenase (NAD(P)+)
MAERDRPIAVLGAGSWGTALAIQYARAGRTARLWARNGTHVETMRREGRNARYLPDAPFPERLTVADSLEAALAGGADVLVSVPSHGLRHTLQTLRDLSPPPARLAWATKGFEQDTGLLPHQVASEVFGADCPMAVLSGPTFAREVAAGLPTAMVVAGRDRDFAISLAQSIASEAFRAYLSDDLVGVEVGGAVKNALAIGAGISDGLGYGANTRIALITRGLSEMVRLGVALGARKDTFMGLAGMGDLVLTCTDDQSRNRRMGLALASGRGLEDARREIGQVVEGVFAARAVREVALRHGVDMPIIEQIYRVIYAGAEPRSAVTSLMARSLKTEDGDWVAAWGERPD